MEFPMADNDYIGGGFKVGTVTPAPRTATVKPPSSSNRAQERKFTLPIPGQPHHHRHDQERPQQTGDEFSLREDMAPEVASELLLSALMASAPEASEGKLTLGDLKTALQTIANGRPLAKTERDALKEASSLLYPERDEGYHRAQADEFASLAYERGAVTPRKARYV